MSFAKSCSPHAPSVAATASPWTGETADGVAERNTAGGNTWRNADVPPNAKRRRVVSGPARWKSTVEAREGQLNENADESTEIDKLAAWLRENGADFENVFVVADADPSRRRVVAKRAIPAGEPIARLPPNLHMDITAARREYPCLAQRLPDRVTDGNRLIMRAFLLLEKRKGDRSFWNPYIAALPETFDTPQYWTKEEREMLLGGTNLQPAVEAREEMLKAEWRILSAYGVSDIAWEEYLWASTVFSSRAFPDIPRRISSTHAVAGTTSANVQCQGEILLPGLDMLNHACPNPITWIVNAESGTTFVAGQSIEQGEEVFNNYGAKSNEELLLGYGFALPDNPMNFVPVKMRPPVTTGLPRHLVQGVLDALAATDGRHLLYRKRGIPSTLMTMLRLAVMNTCERCRYVSALRSIDDATYVSDIPQEWKIPFVSYRVELAALEAARTYVESKLEEYWTTAVRVKACLQDHAVREDRASAYARARTSAIYLAGQISILEEMARFLARRQILVVEDADLTYANLGSSKSLRKSTYPNPPYVAADQTYLAEKEKLESAPVETGNVSHEAHLELMQALEARLGSAMDAVLMPADAGLAAGRCIEDENVDGVEHESNEWLSVAQTEAADGGAAEPGGLSSKRATDAYGSATDEGSMGEVEELLTQLDGQQLLAIQLIRLRASPHGAHATFIRNVTSWDPLKDKDNDGTVTTMEEEFANLRENVFSRYPLFFPPELFSREAWNWASGIVGMLGLEISVGKDWDRVWALVPC